MSAHVASGEGAEAVAPARGPGGMFVEESGDPGSPAIVFVHGAGQSGREWRGHMAGLPVDYPQFAAMGLRLDRTETLAQGGQRCDFRVSRGRPVNVEPEFLHV